MFKSMKNSIICSFMKNWQKLLPWHKLTTRDGVYYRQSITITIIITLPSITITITITFQIFKSITITITITLQSITSITFYYFLLHFMRLVQIRT